MEDTPRPPAPLPAPLLAPVPAPPAGYRYSTFEEVAAGSGGIQPAADQGTVSRHLNTESDDVARNEPRHDGEQTEQPQTVTGPATASPGTWNCAVTPDWQRYEDAIAAGLSANDALTVAIGLAEVSPWYRKGIRNGRKVGKHGDGGDVEGPRGGLAVRGQRG